MRVVIVGGGAAGVTLAARLDATLDVVLVDTKARLTMRAAAALVTPAALQDFFEYTPSTIAVAGDADAAHARRRWIGIVRAHAATVRRGRVVVARAVAVTPADVLLSTGERLTFDALCLCVGSHRPGDVWRVPADVHDGAARWAQLARLRDGLATARSVLVIGGGPVGVELAAELCARHPKTRVALVAAQTELLGRLPHRRMRERSLDALRLLGCNVRLAQRAYRREHLDGTVDYVCEPSGEVLRADVVCDCTGYVPNTAFLREGMAEHLDAAGFVRVTSALHLHGLPHIFVLGDANDVPQEKLLSAAVRQAEHVADQLLAWHHRGASAEPNPYPGTLDSQAVSLGPARGVWNLSWIVDVGWSRRGSLLAVPFKHLNEARMLYFIARDHALSTVHRWLSSVIDALFGPGPGVWTRC